MKVAYVVNQYPKVSHTFIRREIEALEAEGVEVHRVSIRPPEGLVDEDDLAEAARTHVLLQDGARGLLPSTARVGLTSPRLFTEALARSIAMGRRSDRGIARHGAYLAEATMLLELTRARGIDHVHAHFGTNPATVAMLCHLLGGPPFSFTVHGPEEFDKPEFIHLGEKIERARFVVAISHFGRSQLLRRASLAQWPKIHVVRCGLDAAFLNAEETPLPERPRLVSVGRLTEQKGQALLVEAAARLARAGVSFELVFVGDGELRPALEAQILREGLTGHVRITGWASNDTVRRELRDARALVLPSFAEGLPVVVMEALALGRPVVSTYVAGIPELVTEGECGWLIPAGSVAALEDALRRVLSTSTAALERLGAEGRRRVRERHDVRKEARRLLRLFRDPRASVERAGEELDVDLGLEGQAITKPIREVVSGDDVERRHPD